MPKQYLLEAGTFPELSYTELICVLESFGYNKESVTKFSPNIFILQNDKFTDILIQNIFNRLGGAIRYGEIIKDIDTFLEQYQTKQDKIIFGISILGQTNREDSRFQKKLGNQIKRGFKETGIPSRFVLPMRKELSLNSAQITKNNILTKGFELCIIRNNSTEIYVKTLGIQNIEEFVERDIDKPYTDIEMGTLPPKLARMMINFTAMREGVLWDPFCGSGTIPMEGATLGFNILASDIDYKAITSTDENIKWLNREDAIKDTLYETFILDITKPDKKIISKLRKTEINAIVCEPYMGPPQKRFVSEQHANELLLNVKKLYESLFNLIDERLEKRGIKVIIIIPSYKTEKGWKTFGIRDIITNRWILKNTEYSPHRDLKWSRKNSIITRNIYILERS